MVEVMSKDMGDMTSIYDLDGQALQAAMSRYSAKRIDYTFHSGCKSKPLYSL